MQSHLLIPFVMACCLICIIVLTEFVLNRAVAGPGGNYCGTNIPVWMKGQSLATHHSVPPIHAFLKKSVRQQPNVDLLGLQIVCKYIKKNWLKLHFLA